MHLKVHSFWKIIRHKDRTDSGSILVILPENTKRKNTDPFTEKTSCTRDLKFFQSGINKLHKQKRPRDMVLTSVASKLLVCKINKKKKKKKINL